MKKNLTALFAVILLLTSPTFAKTNIDPSLQIQNEFNRMFAQSTEVKWEEVTNFHKVTFMYEEQYLTAYYNPLGEFVSVSRNISTNMLPILLHKGLREKLDGFWISESFEVSGNNGSNYYVTLENATEKTLYVSNSTSWSVYRNSQK